ncbi:DUF2946 domain-containing protein [Pseudomonas sp. VD9]|uniref:DUF2946 domain-containing protein n=3 Tax=Pseudomonas TaxID=286 RepID=UPI003C6C2ABA
MGAPRARLSPHRRVMRGSWISLFAMLMIFIGPLISQAMPTDQHAGMSMAMSMDMPNCHGESKPTKTPDEHHVLWEKCGYCSLLFSCPALPGSVSFMALGPTAGQCPHPLPAPGPCPAEHFPRRTQPRAPHRLVNP